MIDQQVEVTRAPGTAPMKEAEETAPAQLFVPSEAQDLRTKVSLRQDCVKGDIDGGIRDYRRTDGRSLRLVYLARMESMSSPTP